jgi:glutathione S-transferase
MSEKAAIERALKRCRRLAAQIERELRNKGPEDFVDKLSLADFWVSLEIAANLLWQSRQSGPSVDSEPAVKGPQARHR